MGRSVARRGRRRGGVLGTANCDVGAEEWYFGAERPDATTTMVELGMRGVGARGGDRARGVRGERRGALRLRRVRGARCRGTPPDGSSPIDGTIGQEGSVGADGGSEDGNEDVSAPEDAATDSNAADAPSCGPDASTAYCGEDAGCVDTTSSLENCGSCGHACTVPANGEATCTASGCGITCNTEFVACNGACVPNTGEPSQDPCVVTSANGIFVAPTGVDTAAGTEAAPVLTIAKGVALAKTAGLAVFVCVATYPAPLSFTVAQDGVKVYGGLVCPGAGVTNAWSYSGGQVMVAPTTAGTTALTTSGLAVGMTFEDFVFQSSNASGVDANGNGNSSIAVSVSTSNGMVFKRVAMIAGTGAGGNPGTTEEANSGTQAGQGGSPPSAAPATGGQGCVATCPNGVGTQAGSGGLGGALSGGAGQNGLPDLSADAGIGGAGQTAINGGCGVGTLGAPGGPGSPGDGSQTLGMLTSSGWSPGGTGTNGTAGDTAQGGGGGGGATYSGAPTGGGGGGGCGGCGGGLGTGGAAGGASIALVSIASGVALDGCTLSSANGGMGGQGGAGQAGQQGGNKGGAAGDGCQGGAGGNGGTGGGGGGGAGGSAFDIAYTGTEPTQNSTTLSAPGSGGPGGQPGTNGAAVTGVGMTGASATTMSF